MPRKQTNKPLKVMPYVPVLGDDQLWHINNGMVPTIPGGGDHVPSLPTLVTYGMDQWCLRLTLWKSPAANLVTYRFFVPHLDTLTQDL